jgi:hypothetical protein
MLSLVLALIAAQTVASQEAAPGRGVVVLSSRNEGLTPIEVVALTDRLSRALQDVRVSVAMSPDEAASRLGPQRSPASCLGKPECFAELGRVLGVGAVVALDSSKVFDDLPMRIMLLDTRQGQVLLRRSYTVSALRPAELDTAFQSASQEIRKSLTGEGALPTDAPSRLVLYPEAEQALPPGWARPTLAPVYVTRGGAAVAGGAALFFLARGLAQAAELQREREPGVSAWTYARATELRREANSQLLLSGVLAGAAGALLATSFLLPAPEPAK